MNDCESERHPPIRMRLEKFLHWRVIYCKNPPTIPFYPESWQVVAALRSVLVDCALQASIFNSLLHFKDFLSATSSHAPQRNCGQTHLNSRLVVNPQPSTRRDLLKLFFRPQEWLVEVLSIVFSSFMSWEVDKGGFPRCLRRYIWGLMFVF